MSKFLDILLNTVLIVILTVMLLWPREGSPPESDGFDKLLHLIAFAIVVFPLARTGRIGVMPLLIGASVYGALIELIQPSFNRSAEFNDWVADIAGVIIGTGFGLLYRRLRWD